MLKPSRRGEVGVGTVGRDELNIVAQRIETIAVCDCDFCCGCVFHVRDCVHAERTACYWLDRKSVV